MKSYLNELSNKDEAAISHVDDSPDTERFMEHQVEDIDEADNERILKQETKVKWGFVSLTHDARQSFQIHGPVGETVRSKSDTQTESSIELPIRLTCHLEGIINTAWQQENRDCRVCF